MARFTVVICCANSQDTIEAACQSVLPWADELIVVDSGSKDRTGEIGQRLAHKYVVEPWRGYTRQKEFGASLASNDWVVILDGDEEISAQLAEQLSQMSDQELDRYDVLLTPRRNWIGGRPVRAWWPDWQSRVIHRHRVRWPDEALHERREPGDPSRQRRLTGWIEHKRVSAAGFTDYFSGRRMDERLLMVARQMHQRGKRCHWWDLVLRPWGAFWKFYLLKRSFLDGSFGWLIAQKAAVSAQLKYAALWAVQNGWDVQQVGTGNPAAAGSAAASSDGSTKGERPPTQVLPGGTSAGDRPAGG